MRIKISNERLKYNLTYKKEVDKNKVNPPTYIPYQDVYIFKEEKWIPCNLKFVKKSVEISPKVYKNGESILGKVDSYGIYKTMELSSWTKFKINSYIKFNSYKINFSKIIDKGIVLRKNLFYILIAAVLATLYFLINYFWDNCLFHLINGSNLIQSIIIFLTISSVINIFHPFSLRKEVSKKDIDEISEIKTKKVVDKLKWEKELEKRIRL